MRTRKNDDGVTIITFLVIIAMIFVWAFTQRYVEDDSGMTATKGIVFTRTIELDKYQKIGDGRGLFGNYDLITRSMTQGQGETTKVYK